MKGASARPAAAAEDGSARCPLGLGVVQDGELPHRRASVPSSDRLRCYSAALAIWIGVYPADSSGGGFPSAILTPLMPFIVGSLYLNANKTSPGGK